MSHEQSETIQTPEGKWINVYGVGTPQAGQPLPNSPEYGTVTEAVAAAKQRSLVHGQVLKDISDAVSGAYVQPQPSLLEKLVNWWQEGAKAPQPQAYDPRRYPQRGVWPFSR